MPILAMHLIGRYRYRPLKMGFYRLQTEHNFKIRKRIVDMDVVQDVTTCSGQSLVTRVVIRFLWHNVR